MTSEDWSRLKPLFDQALELPADGRSALIEQVRSEDPVLAAHLALLLEVEGNAANDPVTDKPLVNLKELIPSDEFFASGRTDTAAVKQIGRYRIVKELGHGGMGTVYEAVDPAIGRSIAIKTIRLENLGSNQIEFLRDRLFREARLAGKLSHSGIVIIHDVGEHSGAAYIAMELVNGPSLEQVLATNQRLGYARALDILAQAAKALDYAHQHGVIHRDVKPANLMIHEGRTVKIADFGIAKIVETVRTRDLNDDTTTAFLTQPGKVMGTPSYMSPEQMRAEAVTGQADQFSLAVVGFRLLTAMLPFRSDSIPGLVHEIVYGVRPAVRQYLPDLPPETDQVFKKALARSPEERFASCAEFVNSLERAMRAPRPAAAAPRISTPAKAPQPSIQRRSAGFPALFGSRLGWAIAGLLAIVAAAFTIYRITQPNSTAEQRFSAPAPLADPDASDPSVSKATFSAEPQQIQPGQPVNLQWRVPGATTVSIDPGIGTVPGSGSREVRPSVSTTYILTAGSGETTSITVEVATPLDEPAARVRLRPPSIDYFRVEPSSVKPGEPMNLVWNVLGARKILIDHGIGSVVADAGRTIPAPAQSTTYRLHATGKGGSADARATVTILNDSPPAAKTSDAAPAPAQVYNLSEPAMMRRLVRQVPATVSANLTNGLPPVVRLAVLVDPQGNVGDIQYASGNRTLYDAAKAAASEYRYRPYVVKGRPVAVRTEITVQFHVEK